MSAPIQHNSSLLQSLAHQLTLLLDPLAQATASEEGMERLLARLGVYTADAGPAATLGALLDLKVQIEALAAQDDLSFEAAEAAMQLSRDVFTLADAISDAGVDSGAMPGIGRDLVDLLIETWLAVRHPVAREVLALLTLLETGPDGPARPLVVVGDVALRGPIQLDHLRLDRLPALLRDPVAVLAAEYVNALATDDEAEAMADRLFPRLVALLRALGVSCRYGFKVGDEPQLGDAAPLMRHALIIYAVDPLLNAEAEAGVVLTLSPTSKGDLGLVASPFGVVGFTKQFDRWTFESTLAGQLDVLAWGRHGLTLLAQPPDAQITADLVGQTVPSGEGPAHVLGAQDGTRIELGSVRLAAGLLASVANQSLTLSADVGDAALVISPGTGDGFLSSVMPAQGLRTDLDLGLVWSSESGITLRGSGGLEAVLPTHVSAGGVTLSRVRLSLHVQDTALLAEIAADIRVTLGPVQAVVDGIGLGATLSFPEKGGGFGVADLDIGVKSPTGIGLTIDAGPIRGGGYLSADHDRGEYAGALELMLGPVGVKAIGVLAQRPDGWSLLLVLYGQFPPIQLSFGFTLTGVGGLVGVGHGIDIPALTAGLKTGAFDDILFPDEPVANAAQLISRLRTIFPLRPGAMTIGPMVELEWGRPRPIAFVRLAILLQLDNAVGSGSIAFSRVVLIGNVRIALGPSDNDPDAAIVRLIVDFLGLWDADRECYGFLARLRDSRLGPVDVVGALGVWGEYGDHPRFLLAAGGFNPRFNDVPAEVSGVLDRLGAAFKVGRFELTLKGYFALTPCTVQAGVDLSARGKVGPVGIKGVIGFDALVHREPYTHFIVDFRVLAEVTYRGRTLAGVKVTGVLEGPGRWHIVGQVTFSILWWDISKSFDESWGTAVEAATSATDVAALIAAELAKPANWSASLPAGSQALVLLAPPPGDLATLAHPLGRFVFTQSIAPLGLLLERYGSGPVAGPRRFDIEGVTIGDKLMASPPRMTEHFARAEFVEVGEEDRLTKPSFEELDAGVEFASSEFHVPAGLTADLDYERTAYLDVDPRRPGHTRPAHGLGLVAVDSAFVGVLAANGAAGRAPHRWDELMGAQTHARLKLSTPPLAVVDRDRFELGQESALAGRARFATMLAEQTPAHRGVQLVEEFEL